MTTAPISAPADRRSVLAAFRLFVAVAIALLTWAKWWPYSVKIPKAAETHALGTSIIGREFCSAGLLAHRGHRLRPRLLPVHLAGPGRRSVHRRRGDGAGAQDLGGTGPRGPRARQHTAGWVAVGTHHDVHLLHGSGCGRAAQTRGQRRCFRRILAGQPGVEPRGARLQFLRARLAVDGPARGGGRAAGPGGRALTRPRPGVVGPAIALPAAETGSLAARFVRAVGSMAVRLLPEYLLLVVALGALRGPLFTGGLGLRAGVLAVLIFAAAGALLPIPTAGEIPVIAALLALGVSAPVAAALLITLPAISVPSLVMVRRVFPAKVLGGTTAGVLALGLLIAGAAALIGL